MNDFVLSRFRRLFLLLAVTLTLTVSAAAQTKTFDLVTFTPPKGWDETVTADAILYSKEDTKGDACTLRLYRSISASSDSNTNFDKAWESLVRDSLGVTSAPEREAMIEEKGWRAESGYAQFTYQGANCVVALIAMTRGSQLVNLVVITNSADFEKEITAFSDSFSFKPAAPVASQPPAAVKEGGAGPIPEVWMVNKFKIKPGYDVVQMTPVWVAFFPNGDYFPYFPEGGFWNFDLKRSGQSWGKATHQGNTIAARSSYGNIDFVKKGPEHMESPNYTSNTWYKCRSVDGLRLEGAYTPDLDVYNKTTGFLPAPEKRPIIFFKKDGTFINEGLSYANVTRSPDYALGSGTYQIKNFSLILNYADGRRVQVGFVGIKNVDPAGEPTTYFINNLLNYKLKS